MLEPRSVAVVGASARPGSFGERLATEALRSRWVRQVHLVNPAYDEVLGRTCVASLADLEEPVDLVLMGVPDSALLEQVRLAGAQDAKGVVVFGSARGLGSSVASAAAAAGLAVCGAGCMGFVNVSRGVRAIGYLERDPLVPGPVALVTHSGSVFSALLRTHRRLELSLAVSSGQELVTTTADYLDYALSLPETRVVGLFLETMRDVPRLRDALARAAEDDVPVVALTVGESRTGRSLVASHSGALAGGTTAWEALFGAYGVHRVSDLDELVDTLELFAVGRRARRRATSGRQHGIATVHDSGGERAMAADLAETAGVRFAALGPATTDRLASLLEDGLLPSNPLDVWGTGADTEELFADCLTALAADEAVEVTALAVDLVEEYDGDESYPDAVLRAHEESDAPLVVLCSLAAAVDQVCAGRLRAAGVPVLEGLSSGLRALGHLVDAAAPVTLPEHAWFDGEASRLAGVVQGGASHLAGVVQGGASHLAGAVEGEASHSAGVVHGEASLPAGAVDGEASHLAGGSALGGDSSARSSRWAARLAGQPLSVPDVFDLLSDYGLDVARPVLCGSVDEVLYAAEVVGYPVVLKTAATGVSHKVDVDGVLVGLRDEHALALGYADLAARLGADVLVQPMIQPGVELSVGIVHDPHVGPLVMVAVGGTLVELVAARAVALPPVGRRRAAAMLESLPQISALLEGVRGQEPSDRDAVESALVAVATIAWELGTFIEALDVNPLICEAKGATAVDVLLVRR
jgi:acyl-CoA synthetase (NDP forming)